MDSGSDSEDNEGTAASLAVAFLKKYELQRQAVLLCVFIFMQMFKS